MSSLPTSHAGAEEAWADVQRVVGPTTTGLTLLFLLSGLFFQQLLSFASSGRFLRLPRRSSQVYLVVLAVLELAYVGVGWAEQHRLSVSHERFELLHRGYDGLQAALPLLNGVVAALAQGFLAVKAFESLSHRDGKLVYAGWAITHVFLSLVGSVLVCIQGATTEQGVNGLLSLTENKALSLWLTATAVANLSTSAVLARNAFVTSSSRSSSFFGKVMTHVDSTTLLPTLLSLAAAVVALTFTSSSSSTTTSSSTLWLPLAPLYGMSILSLLSPSASSPLTASPSPLRNLENRSLSEWFLSVATAPPSFPSSDFSAPSANNTQARPPHKTHSRRSSSWSRHSLPPLPSPPTPAKRLSGKFDVRVTTEVERRVEQAAYEEILVGLGKGEKVKRWLEAEDGEDEAEVDKEEEEEEKEEEVGSEPKQGDELV
ncbi:hypothetical protein JCM8547_004672 [Rhodosporidiobolus lusitaniae]